MKIIKLLFLVLTLGFTFNYSYGQDFHTPLSDKASTELCTIDPLINPEKFDILAKKVSLLNYAISTEALICWWNSIRKKDFFYRDSTFLGYIKRNKLQKKIKKHISYSKEDLKQFYIYIDQINNVQNNPESLEYIAGIYKKILVINPNFLDLLAELANVYNFNGQINNSIETYKKLYLLTNKDSTYLLEAIKVAFNAKDFERALKIFNEYEAAHYLSQELKIAKIDLLKILAKHDEAIELVEEMEKASGNKFYYENLKASILLHKKDTSAALQHMFNTYLSAPSVAEGQTYLFSLLQHKSLKTHLRSFVKEKLLQYSEDETLLRIQLSFCNEQNDSACIIKTVNQLIKAFPDSSKYYYYKAQYLYQMADRGNPPHQVMYPLLKQAIALDSFNLEYYDAICRSHMWKNPKVSRPYKKLAVKMMEKKAFREGSTGLDWYELGLAYDLPSNGYGANGHLYDEMIIAYDSAIKLGFDSLKVIKERSYILYKSELFNLALEDYKFLNQHYTNPYAINYYNYYIAHCYRGLKDYEKALIIYEQIKASGKDNGQIDYWIKMTKKGLKK